MTGDATESEAPALMPDRTKLIVHLRRLSGVLEVAIRNGPDGSLEGKFASEHPVFVHYACAFYLIGCFAFLEGEDGAYSWDIPSTSHADFDTFVSGFPAPPKASLKSKGISKNAMRALADIRNAITHHDGDLSKLNRAKKNIDIASAIHLACLPGVVLVGSVVTLNAGFLEFVRIATLAARAYQDEY